MDKQIGIQVQITEYGKCDEGLGLVGLELSLPGYKVKAGEANFIVLNETSPIIDDNKKEKEKFLNKDMYGLINMTDDQISAKLQKIRGENMKEKTAEQVMEYLRAHPIHECMKKDIVAATGLGTTTVNIIVEWLVGAGKIRVARMYGNAKVYEVV